MKRKKKPYKGLELYVIAWVCFFFLTIGFAVVGEGQGAIAFALLWLGLTYILDSEGRRGK